MLGRRPLMVLIILLSIFGPLSTDMCLSALPQMAVEFGTSESVMSMSLYMFMLVLAFAILVMGPISDKFGRRNTLTVSMAIYVSMSFACCFAHFGNPYLFVFYRMMQAIGAGGALTIAFALIKDCFTGDDMRKTLSVTAAIGILGPMLAPVIGAALIKTIDWGATFWFPGIVAAICLFLGLMLPSDLPEMRSTSVKNALKGILNVGKNRIFMAFCFMMTAFTGAQLAYISVSTYIYQNGFGFDETQYSIALAGTCVIGLIVSVVIRRIRAITNRRMIVAIFMLGVAGLLLLLFVAEFHWLLFFVSMIPIGAIVVTTRSYGYGILMGNHEGDNGAVSAILNFCTFAFAFLGMMTASSFPSDVYIYGIAAVTAAACVIFFVLWMIVKSKGYPLKGLEE